MERVDIWKENFVQLSISKDIDDQIYFEIFNFYLN